MSTVLLYTPGVLPPSQTFVADQARGLTKWSPVLVGRECVEGGLVVDDLVAEEMHGVGRQGRVRRLGQMATRRVPLLREVTSRMRPDLLHAHFLTGGFDVVSSLRPLPCPLVVTAHGFDATWYGSPLQTLRPDRWLHGVLRARLVRQPVHFIAVSRFIRDQLLRHGAPEDAVVVHHTGVDTAYFTPSSTLAERRRGILFVGRLVPKKGALDLLEAVARLRTRGMDVPVEIIGDGPLRRQIEHFANRERLDVTVRGFQPRSVVRGAMRRAAVQCNPSRTGPSGDREGFGMVLAEAQSTGLPVVATTSGGMVDAVDHGRTGLLVPEGDTLALTQALCTCLTNSDLHRSMSAAARPWVLENFDLTRQTATLEEHYDQWASGIA